MLYKVTPMMPSAEEKPSRAKREPGQPRPKRKSAVYDHEGNEILITLMCLKCRCIKPLGQFGLRKMADGAIRNQPWCRTCRSGAGTRKPKDVAAVTPEAQPVAADAAAAAEASEGASVVTVPQQAAHELAEAAPLEEAAAPS